MTCSQCELRLAEGGALDSATLEHLRECPECRAMQQDLAENALALSALREVTIPVRAKRSFPWLSFAAAAAIAAIVLVQAWQFKSAPPKPLRLQAERPEEITVAIKAPPPAILTQARQAKAKEPLKIKMLTDDPDVVIYWLVDSQEGN